MSNLFKDKAFEELDDISKLVEPTTWSFISEIENLPERIDHGPTALANYIKSTYYLSNWGNGLFQVDAVGLLRQQPFYRKLDNQQRIIIDRSYRLIIEGSISINAQTNEAVGGTIYLVKDYKPLEEKQLMALIGYKTYENLCFIQKETTQTAGRLKEILDLLNSKEGLKCRSFSNRRSVLIKEVGKIFTDDKWKIRNVDLSNKVSTWVADYINTGNISSLANFCKLKAMTHKVNGAIYSIEEES